MYNLTIVIFLDNLKPVFGIHICQWFSILLNFQTSTNQTKMKSPKRLFFLNMKHLNTWFDGWFKE